MFLVVKLASADFPIPSQKFLFSLSCLRIEQKTKALGFLASALTGKLNSDDYQKLSLHP
jgi:hypothetical protein